MSNMNRESNWPEMNGNARKSGTARVFSEATPRTHFRLFPFISGNILVVLFSISGWSGSR